MLFALSLILVAITLYRVVSVIDRHYDQRFRSLLASLEILAAAAVSNALVLGSFVRDRGTKKQRFRFGSTGGHSSLERSTTAPRRAITARTWGSDADLVGDLGMRLDPELTEKPISVPRPAPVAMSLHSTSNPNTSNLVDTDWASPTGQFAEKDEIKMNPSAPISESQPGTSDAPITPRRMSFFDVGGLLGENDPPTFASEIQRRHISDIPRLLGRGEVAMLCSRTLADWWKTHHHLLGPPHLVLRHVLRTP